MAISLNGDGLYLSYPTSTQTSGGKYPVGCVVIYANSRGSSYSLTGTWAMYWYNHAYNNDFELTSTMRGGTQGDSNVTYKALAIRIA